MYTEPVLSGHCIVRPTFLNRPLHHGTSVVPFLNNDEPVMRDNLSYQTTFIVKGQVGQYRVYFS